ncbi:MAG TPA: YHS domain-containing (seleno)protein [Ferruginibacter sp.]|nr:YHS domain-containing (seleno)protein [Ferruginibacter sp.]HMP20521.1 YHS domain-containing (seleno)protein [Ferruginibacter sp.]
MFSTKNGALNGYDVVSFYTDSAAQLGSKAYSYHWKNTTWYFSSATHRDTFSTAPEKFYPAYGGWCAYGASNGYKAPTEATTFTFVDGRLYFNYNEAVKNNWLKNTNDYIAKADAHWPVIKNKD